MPDGFHVILPAFNTAPFLDAALASVCDQSVGFPNIQITIVDDGSTDGTGALADEWAADLAHVRVLHQKNTGAAAARNAGWESAQAWEEQPYVLFMDADDVLAPDALLTLRGALRGCAGAAAASGLCIRINAAGQTCDDLGQAHPPRVPAHSHWVLHATPMGETGPLVLDFPAIVAGIPRTPIMPPAACLIRATALARIAQEDGPVFDPSLRGCEDSDFFYRLAAAGKLLFLPQVTAQYRVRPGQLTEDRAALKEGDAEVLSRRSRYEALYARLRA